MAYGLPAIGELNWGAKVTASIETLSVEWVEAHLVNGGVGDQTAAFQAAINALPANGGIVRFLGDYTVGTTVPIEFPAEPKVIHLIGNGKLLQGAANAVMIRKTVGVSRVFGAKIMGFTVVAHGSSSKATTGNVALELIGFDGAEVNIRAEGNATYTSTNGRFYAVVSGHANTPYFYNNRIRVVCVQTAGPAKIVWLHNGGGGVSANANLTRVSVLAYALDACDVGVDAADTTQTIVHDSLFESCTGMTAVKAGNFTTTRDNWFESVAVAINYTATADTIANNCVSQRDQFSSSNTIVIHSSVTARPEFQHSLFGTMTFQNESAVATTDYRAPRTFVQPTWTTAFSFVLGGGTLTADAFELRLPIDHHGRTTYALRYFITPTATGRGVLRFTPPTGFEVEQAHVAAYTGSATPLVAGLSNATTATDWEFYWPSTAMHTLNIRVTLKATS